jgi:hypothetical protein
MATLTRSRRKQTAAPLLQDMVAEVSLPAVAQGQYDNTA